MIGVTVATTTAPLSTSQRGGQVNINNISQEHIRNILSYNSDTGIFYRKKTSNNGRYKSGTIIGHKNIHGYMVIKILGKLRYAHRLAWLYIHGSFPSGQIDHINGVRNDNRIINLRVVNNLENHKNQKKYSNNSSGITGVYWYERYRKWAAQITINGKVKYLGRFEEVDDAISARKAAEIENAYHPNHGQR